MVRRGAIGLAAAVLSLGVVVPAAVASSLAPSRIVFVRSRATDTGHYTHARLWAMRADGTGLHSLLGPNATGNDGDPAWSPDGDRVAFVQGERHRSGGRMFVVDSNGTHLIQITPPWLAASVPTWAPDGTQIAFSGSGTRSHRRSGWTQIWVIDVDGTHLHPVTHTLREHLDPDWSPDGTSLAYERMHSVFTRQRIDRTGNIHVKGLGVGDGRAITDMIAGHEAFQPAWSPDGSAIVFATYRNSFSPFGTKLWTANADGSNPREVRHVEGFTFDQSPVWSPGGGEILFSEQGFSRTSIFTRLMVMRSDGRHARTLLARPNEFYSEPDWTNAPTA